MLPEELVQLVEDVRAMKCELQAVELKKAAGGCPLRLYDTLSSFSNQAGGGTIIFGIDQDAGYKVVGVYDAQDLQVKVTQQSAQMSPPVRPLFTVARVGDCAIVSAEIPECDALEKPCFYVGAGRLRGSYIRVGEADLPMTEYEVYSYEAFRRKISDELRIVDRADMTALDGAELQLFLLKLKQAKPNFLRLDDEQTLRLQGIGEKGQPTLAGLMLFGVYPQAWFPQLCITAIVVPGTEMGDIGGAGERFIDNRRIEGTIQQVYEQAMAFVKRNMRTRTIVSSSGGREDRSEYPLIAVREVLVNALIHRDYSVHTESSPIRILMFDDRMEVENPGGLYGRLTLDDLGKVGADTRNPYLASALEVLMSTENRFSGIPTIVREMDRAGLPPPVFENRRSAFKVTLYNENEVKGDDVRVGLSEEIITYCAVPRTRSELAKRFGYAAPSYLIRRYIRPLVDQGILRMSVPDTPKSKLQRYVRK